MTDIVERLSESLLDYRHESGELNSVGEDLFDAIAEIEQLRGLLRGALAGLNPSNHLEIEAYFGRLTDKAAVKP